MAESILERVARGFTEAVNPKAKWARLARETKGQSSGLVVPAQTPRKSSAKREKPISLPSPYHLPEKKSFTLAETLPSSVIGKPQTPTFSADRPIQEGLKANTWVYAPVFTLATSLGIITWKVMEFDATEEKWAPSPGSPLQILLDRPNAFHSRKAFFERMAQQLFMTGNGVASMVMAGGLPVELWPLQSQGVKPVPTSDNTLLSHYDYKPKGAAKAKRLEAHEALHIMFQDPETPWWGLSPLQAAMDVVDTDREQVSWNKTTLANRAVTDGVFSVPEYISPTQYVELKAQVAEQHQGKDNAHTPWVLGNGAAWQQMSLSPVELDWIQSRKMNREELAAIFRVPLPMLQVYENATLANIETARRIFWQDTMMPLAQDFADVFNLSLVPYFEANDGKRYEVRPSFARIPALWSVFVEKLSAAKEMFSMGVPMATIDDMLELGIGEYPGADVGLLPAGLVPASIVAIDTFGDEE